MFVKRLIISVLFFGTSYVLVASLKLVKRDFLTQCIENLHEHKIQDYNNPVVYVQTYNVEPSYQQQQIQPLLYYIFYYLPYRYNYDYGSPVLVQPYVGDAYNPPPNPNQACEGNPDENVGQPYSSTATNYDDKSAQYYESPPYNQYESSRLTESYPSTTKQTFYPTNIVGSYASKSTDGHYESSPPNPYESARLTESYPSSTEKTSYPTNAIDQYESKSTDRHYESSPPNPYESARLTESYPSSTEKTSYPTNAIDQYESKSTDRHYESSPPNPYESARLTERYPSSTEKTLYPTNAIDQYEPKSTDGSYESSPSNLYESARLTESYPSSTEKTSYPTNAMDQYEPKSTDGLYGPTLSDSYNSLTITTNSYVPANSPSSNTTFYSSSQEETYPSPTTTNSYSSISTELYTSTTTEDPKNECNQYKGSKCDEISRFRTYDGSCNNINLPARGMANTKFTRLRSPIYFDGISEPAKTKAGHELPNPRQISFTLFPHAEVPDPLWNVLAMQWGQFMSHDMSKIDISESNKAKCCSDNHQLINNEGNSSICFSIKIPVNDPVYSSERQQCHHFLRSTTEQDNGCPAASRSSEQLNTESAFLDLSMIYGSSKDAADALRDGKSHFLKTSNLNGRVWLPQTSNRDQCIASRESNACYASGDNRVNMNPQLAVMHLIFVREHNRIANQLANMNKNWDPERVFQETRKILIAINQHISYYEWLPIFIGKENSFAQRVLFNTNSWVHDYDSNVDPSVINEYANAAFRYFHSLIPGKILLLNELMLKISPALRLSDHYKNPGIIEKNNNFDDISRGMASQPEESSDPFFDKEISIFLFRNNNKLGEDLRAIDIQRGRDHGLASYNDLRELAGLRRARSWADFRDVIPEKSIEGLRALYETPDDVDLSVGGSLEKHAPGALVGPTFQKIITEQFRRTRAGDRYWYETDQAGIRFSEAQLREIRKASASRLFCDNGDNIRSMQRRGFERISQSNPMVDCSQIPTINLSLWKE